MAMNVWNSRGAGPRRDTLGLGEVLIEVPSGDDVGALADRLKVAGVAVAPHRRRTALRGPVAQPDPRRRPLESRSGTRTHSHRVRKLRPAWPCPPLSPARNGCPCPRSQSAFGTCPMRRSRDMDIGWASMSSAQGQGRACPWAGRVGHGVSPAGSAGRDMSTVLPAWTRWACPLLAAGNGHSGHMSSAHGQGRACPRAWVGGGMSAGSRPGEGMSTGRRGPCAKAR